jgi:3'-phosphoadenosine 5'-phosphosulfate sulfotransferase (PAPS reductase)/FAD synthetase
MYPNVKSEVWGLKDWVSLAKGIELNEMTFSHENGKPRRYILVKKKVDIRPSAAGKELFEDQPGYRYSCYVTNMDLPLDQIWNIYNSRVQKGESIRVFPISNWTELDIWQYIRLENIPIVPLYYAKERPVVNIDGSLILVDDERMPKELRDKAEMKMVRFRTLGCYPLTGAIESNATTIEEIVEEMMTVTVSERTTRVIDFDQEASMEQKKREGYF